ncbi:MAG: PAS domain-containing protein [Candidatus Odinarchaeota archaeon]
MSEVKDNEVFSTKLKNETFLRFADNSRMGVLLIQRGFLKYFNGQFTEIFGYTKEDILKWKKREFYKIVHPDDLPNLIKNFNIQDDKKTILVRFRGIRKDSSIIDIENYMCHIKYNNKFAVLSSYIQIKEHRDEVIISRLIKTKEEKRIISDYHLNLIKFLEANNIDYQIIKRCSYREEE